MNKTGYRVIVLAFMFLIAPTFLQSSKANVRVPKGDPIVIQVIELDYANAEDLASVLSPFLSPEGRISAYGPTNSLIIMDRASIVRRLVEIIKGPTDQQP